MKFKSSEDRVCSWTDVSFEAIVICVQLTLVLVGDVGPRIIDISSLLSDPDKEVAAFLGFLAGFERAREHELHVLFEATPIFFKIVTVPLHLGAFDAA